MTQLITSKTSNGEVTSYIQTKLLGADEPMPIMTRVVTARRPTPQAGRLAFEISELTAGIILGLFIAICAMIVAAVFL